MIPRIVACRSRLFAMAENSAEGVLRRVGGIDSAIRTFMHSTCINLRCECWERWLRGTRAVRARCAAPSLRALAVRRDAIRAVRGVGYLWGIDVTRLAGEIVANAREAGLLILTAGDFTLRLLPPLIATREELAHGVAQLERALA